MNGCRGIGLPGSAALRRLVELAEVGDHEVGAGGRERAGTFWCTGNADDEAEGSVPAGGDAGDGILDHGGGRRCDAEVGRAGEVGVRCRFTRQVAFGERVPVDDGIEQRDEADAFEHVAAIAAGGDEAEPAAAGAPAAEQGSRARVHGDAVAVEQLQKGALLGGSDRLHRVGVARDRPAVPRGV